MSNNTFNLDSFSTEDAFNYEAPVQYSYDDVEEDDDFNEDFEEDRSHYEDFDYDDYEVSQSLYD